MPRLPPGELANVDRDGRLQVPSDVLKAVDWWSGKTLRVCAELTYKGLLRVYPSSAVHEVLKAGDHENLTTEAAYIARAASADRYRELSLYGPECRLRLTKEICPWLGFNLGQPATLYAQAFSYGLEVMSMDHRFSRLIETEADVLPWTFKPPS
jgi:hypothetical protein